MQDIIILRWVNKIKYQVQQIDRMSSYPSVKVPQITRNVVDINLLTWRDPGRRPNMDKMLEVALGPVHRSVNCDLRMTISQNVDAAELAFYIIKQWTNEPAKPTIHGRQEDEWRSSSPICCRRISNFALQSLALQKLQFSWSSSSSTTSLLNHHRPCCLPRTTFRSHLISCLGCVPMSNHPIQVQPPCSITVSDRQ